MSYRDQLVGEINSVLDGLSKLRQPWRAQFITHEVCGAHVDGLADGEDAEFWRFGGYQTTRKLVTECINRRAGPKADRSAGNEQFAFPGFAQAHLQNYYVVNRNGEELGVFIGELTDEEINTRASLFRAQATSSLEHADELIRFKEWRRSQAKSESAA